MPWSPPSSVLDGDRHFYLDGAPARERRHTDCGPGMPTRIAEHICEHSARTVDHRRLLMEIGRGRHVAGNGQDPFDPVERAKRDLQHRQRVQGAHGSGFAALVHADGVAQSTQAGEATFDAWQLAGSPSDAIVDHDGVQRIMWRMWPVHGESELGEASPDNGVCHLTA